MPPKLRLALFVEYGDGSDTMMVKPMKTLELRYPDDELTV